MSATIQRHMSLGELLDRLRAEGCHNANADRINRAISDGRLPKPIKDASNRRLYDSQFMERARRLMLELPSYRGYGRGLASTLVCKAGSEST